MDLTSNLLHVDSPKKLYQWMHNNLKYSGANKGYLRLPKDVIEDKKAQCWESAELARVELCSLDINCKTVFLVNAKNNATHSTIIYEVDKQWHWFEWAWGKYEGIHDFKSKDEVLSVILAAFEKQYGTIGKMTSNGMSAIKKDDTEKTYFQRATGWRDITPKKAAKQRPKVTTW